MKESGIMSENFCSHKDSVESFCKKCRIYLCAACQNASHAEHIEEITTLEMMVKQSIGDYSLLIATCEKQLEQTLPVDQHDAVEKELLRLEKSLWESYAGIVQESNQAEALHIAAVSDSKIVDKMRAERSEFETHALPDLKKLEQKLDSSISKLIVALTNEDYTSTMPFVESKFREEIEQEFDSCSERTAPLKQFIDHEKLFESVQPQVPHSASVISKLITVKGPFEQQLKLITYDIEAQSVFVYIPESFTARKYPIVDTRIPKGFAQIAFDYNKLFLCGGKTMAPQYFKDAFVFCETDEQIVQVPSMNRERANHGICNREDKEIFVVGGECEAEDSMKSVEAYQIMNRTWKTFPNMNYSKKNPVVILFGNRYLYALNFVTSVDGNAAAIESLDIVEPKSWIIQNITSDKFPWIHFGCVQISPHEMLLFGGEMKGKKTKKTSIYDTEKQKWRQGQELSSESYFQSGDLVKGKGKVYALSTDKSRVYSYDLTGENWTMSYTEDFTLKYC